MRVNRKKTAAAAAEMTAQHTECVCVRACMYDGNDFSQMKRERKYSSTHNRETQQKMMNK